MELGTIFKIGFHYLNVVVIKKLKPWIELHIKTNQSFWNRIMFSLADGKNNSVEFPDETLMFTILIRNYIYKIIDNFELKGFPKKLQKKYLSLWSNLAIHPKCKIGLTFLWNFDFSFFLLTEIEARNYSEVWLLTKFFCDGNVALWTTWYKISVWMFFVAEIFILFFFVTIDRNNILVKLKVIKNDTIIFWKINGSVPRTSRRTESRSMTRSIFSVFLMTYVHWANLQLRSHLFVSFLWQ